MLWEDVCGTNIWFSENQFEIIHVDASTDWSHVKQSGDYLHLATKIKLQGICVERSHACGMDNLLHLLGCSFNSVLYMLFDLFLV